MLPIKHVVLFKHGVGYFQRSGIVENDQTIELSFRADQMNDVLKSLTALDYDGGKFAALSYDSEEPVDRRLSQLNIHIPEKGAYSGFLDQLKGAKVSVAWGSETLQGTVMGIEEVRRAEKGLVVAEPHLALLAEGGRFVRIPLPEINDLCFLDEAVRSDLHSMLEILFSSLRKDRKRLSIQAMGKGRRNISLSYVVETPVWKTSYRILLPVDGEEKPLLQGWALVDNTTEEDWRGVSLSLVAGLPISFVHDLYSPRYRKRPVVYVQEEAGVAAPVVEAGIAGELLESAEEEEAECPMAHELEPVLDAQMLSAPAMRRLERPSISRAALASIEARTITQEAGDLFVYEITQPVEIGRSRSALVPIIQTEAEVERVALFNKEIREKNPLTALRLKNATGVVLEGGPVTVFEGDGYAGESMLDSVRKDEVRIVPYSVELGVTVKQEVSNVREDYTRVTKKKSHIRKYYRELLVTSYAFVSRLDKERTLYLDHRFQYGQRTETPEPAEVTDSFWRFHTVLKPKETTTFTVKEVSEQYERVEVAGIARSSIHQMADQKLISDKTKAALEKIADKAEEIRMIEEDVQKKDAQEARITNDQKRLRENLKSLGDSSEEAGLRQRYVSALGGQEEQLEKLRLEFDELKSHLDRKRDELEKMVSDLELA